MTLFKQSIPDTEKRALAKAFLTNITPAKERPQIFQVLIDTSILESEDDAPEAAPAAEAPAEAELLKRDFRNYVHPAEQLANCFSPDQHTARIGFQVVLAAADDLVSAEAALAKEAAR